MKSVCIYGIIVKARWFQIVDFSSQNLEKMNIISHNVFFLNGSKPPPKKRGSFVHND